MADNKENSRADDLFEILNEFNDEPSENEVSSESEETIGLEKELSDSLGDNGNDGSRIDEILEILNSGRNDNPVEENVCDEETEIPVALFDHLCDESEADIERESILNSHFSDEADLPEIIPEAEKEDDDDIGEDEEDEYEDDYKYEEVSRVQQVLRFFRGTSFIPKAIIYMLLVVIAAAYLSYYIITIGNDVFALVTDSREITVTIEEGATDATVAQMLEDNGIIEYGWVYELYMTYHGDGEATVYIPGEHKLNTDYNYSQLITALTTKTVKREIVRVTVPEGYTVDQIIDLLVEKGVGQREDYVEAINNYPYKWEFVKLLDEMGYSENRLYRLEGYLFPDTYDFYTTESEVYVINKMLNAFNDRFWKDFTYENKQGESYQKTMLEEYGMTFDDIIVLASMVQSEGGTAEDFYYISYVFHNRLSHPSTFPKLESDATIQYVLPERIEDSSQIDISYDSPYNTYIYNGLPPGAISNPGLDALSAALFPTAPLDSDDDEINAYFFVSNDAGKTYYASGKSAHEKNVAQVKKDNEAIKAGTYGN